MASRSTSWTDLIDEVHVDPVGVVQQATHLLEIGPSAMLDIAGLRWSRGLAYREQGELAAAHDDLAEASELCEAVGDLVMKARIAVSLSIVEMSLGDSTSPHRLLDEAEPFLDGSELGRLVMQRGLLHHRVGDLGLAVENYRLALPMVEAGSDRIAEMRLRVNFGLVLGQTGDPLSGASILATAQELALSEGEGQIAAAATQNIGYMNTLLGRTPEALADYATADRLYVTVNDRLRSAVVGVDRAALYAQAGLNDEAYEEAQRVRSVVEESGNVLDLAETELVAARAALAAERFDEAIGAAKRAGQLFTDNGRVAWAPLAQFIELMAELKQAQIDVDLSARVGALAERLHTLNWNAESVHLRVEAARKLLEAGESAVAMHVLEPIGPPRPGLPVVDGMAAWTAVAMRSLAQNDLTSSRRAVTQGLKLLRSNELAIQALDLRAHVVDQGRSLGEIGVHLAIRSERPREFLSRLEAGNAASVRTTRLPTEARESVAQALAQVRLLEADRRTLVEDGGSTATLDRERAKAEGAVRALRRQLTDSGSETATLGDCITRLGDINYLGFGDVDGETWSVSIVKGRAGLQRVESTLVGEVSDTVLFALNRLARTHASDASVASARQMLDDAALSAMELMPRRIRGNDAPLVISPSASMSGLAWRVVSGLQTRPLSISPSLTAWALADQASSRGGHSLLAVGGPDLVHADREVEHLQTVSQGATVIRSDESSVEQVLAHLENADIAHFACHGTFRADNPMFSSLRLADGDLTIYDLEQCERLPHTIVMSACNAGQNAVLRGGALLGMTSALIQLGVSSVIAPLTPVNDERSVDLMVRLHTHLAAGLAPAEALAKASDGPDGQLDPTAAPFICFGS